MRRDVGRNYDSLNLFSFKIRQLGNEVGNELPVSESPSFAYKLPFNAAHTEGLLGT